MKRTGPASRPIATLHHLAHDSVDADDHWPAERVEQAKDGPIDSSDHAPQHRIGVHQWSVNGENPRNPSTPGDPRRQEREVEELTVLMHDLGSDVVEQSGQVSDRARPDDERQRIVERQVAGTNRSCPKPHDVNTMHVLRVGRVGDRGRHDPHVVPLPRILPSDVAREVGAAGRPRRKEAVDDEDSHPARP